jgi:hypothetical protein
MATTEQAYRTNVINQNSLMIGDRGVDLTALAANNK